MTNPDEGKCGRDCNCCSFGDGTAPVDHEKSCELVSGRWGDLQCSCEGAQQRAVERAKEDVLQYWECSVSHLEGDTFVAVLSNWEDKAFLWATVPIEEVKPEERSLVVPGALFDWGISPFSSSIVFRKDVWTKEEIEEMKKKAEEMFILFNDNKPKGEES